MECEVWSVEHDVWGVECEVWSVEHDVWGVECEVWSVGGANLRSVGISNTRVIEHFQLWGR